MTKPKTELTEIVQAEAAIAEMAKQSAPMTQRLASHRDRMDMAVKELEAERFEMLSRRDQFRRQAEALEAGFQMHIDDLEQTLRLYENGMNSLALPA